MEKTATKGRQGPRNEYGDLVFAEEVYAIIGAAMEVHRVLGHGFLEAVYAEAFSIELRALGIPFRTQAPIEVHYKGQALQKHYVCDLIAFEQIVVELKAIPALGTTETAQTLNYLRATGKPLALLINFGSPAKLEWHRYIGFPQT